MLIRKNSGQFARAPGIDSVRSRFGLYYGHALLAILALANPAGADLLLGIKAGSMDVDMSTTENPTNMAVQVGFQLDNQLADISLMGEVNRTVSKGEARGGGDLEFESEAIFLRVRTTSSLFVSLRGGIVQDKIIVDRDSRSDDGFLLGGGIGVVSGRTRIELEYTSIAGDANFLSLNIEF